MNTISRDRVADILGAWNLEKVATYLESVKLVEDDGYTLFFRYATGASFFKEIDCDNIPYEFEEVMNDNDTHSWVLVVK